MCKDHTQSPGDLMQKINSNLAFSFKRQICYNIINKLINATNSHDAKTYMSDVQEKYNFKARVLGLRLSADIKSYMRNFLREPLTQGGYFRARVSFRGSKFCHALAIQILDKKEFRIIENNSGVLIFDTEEEFLEAFVFYRRYYYYKNKHASMLIFGDYCN